RANGASLARCEVVGLVATVSATRGYLGLSLTATATAGPDDAAGPGGTD
ncbi:MAG: hypothetical protein JWR53_1136, partial [Glaciihabitans sp.]|nr:hypothetical protein [Glaciihabitans sp.]